MFWRDLILILVWVGVVLGVPKPFGEALALTGVFALMFGLVGIIVQIIRKENERLQGTVLTHEAYNRRMQFRGRLWPLLIGLFGSSFIHFAWVNRNKPNIEDLWVGMTMSVAMFAASLSLRIYYRQQRMLGPPKPLVVPPKPKAAQPAPKAVWVFVIVVFVFFLYIMSPVKPKAIRPDAPNNGWIYLSVLGAASLVFVSVIGLRILKYRDRVVMRALHRANDGDLDGAIAELQNEIEMRGPSANRLNGLAALHMMREDYAVALGLCRKGLAFDPKRIDLRTNLAVALLKTGEPEEAEKLLAEMLASGQALGQPTILTNHAFALIALGRLDEAETQLDLAETKLKGTIYLTTLDIKGGIRTEIEKARVKIADARGTKDAIGFAEL